MDYSPGREPGVTQQCHLRALKGRRLPGVDIYCPISFFSAYHVASRCTLAMLSSRGMSFGHTCTQLPALEQSPTPPSLIISFIRWSLSAEPVGCSLKSRTWLITAAPTKRFTVVYCGQASRQQPQEMQRDRG